MAIFISNLNINLRFILRKTVRDHLDIFPVMEWTLSLGNSQGKNQPDGVLKGDRPYLIAPFRDGEKVTFNVPRSEDNLRNSKLKDLNIFV